MAPRPNFLIAATAILSSPGILVAVALSLAGHLNPWLAFGAVVVISLGVGLLLFRPLGRLNEIERRIERIADTPPDDTQPPQPGVDGGPTGNIVAALHRLERIWGRDRAQTRDSLRSAQVLFDALPDPLITLDAQEQIVYANAAARTLLTGRHGVGDLSGRDLSAVIRQPAILQAVSDVLSGDVTRTVEFTFTDRVDQAFEARVEPIQSETSGEDDARALILMRDVTALRRGEQMRADFVANVSHELRTPLTSLVGFIETLRGPARGDVEAQDRFLNLMETQSMRMTRIVNDLLSLSRIEMNEHTPPKDEVQLRQVIATVADLLAPQAAAQDVVIEHDLDALAEPVIGHPDELTVLFQNLIENAIKYGGSGSKVYVRATVTGGMATVSVVDEGEGIPREHIPRLTERFYRVDTARSRELGGTGLGLAIVKHIANRHRGELSIQSEPGIGSTFTVTLPVAYRDTAAC